MKITLQKYFIWLITILSICLLIRAGFLLITLMVAFKIDLDIWEFTQKIIKETWIRKAALESASLLLLSLIIAVIKSSYCPTLVNSKRNDWLKTSPWSLDTPLPWGDYKFTLAEIICLIVIEALLQLFIDWPFGIAIYIFSCYYFCSLHLVSFVGTNVVRSSMMTGLTLVLPLLFFQIFSWLVVPVLFICYKISLVAQKNSWPYWIGFDQRSQDFVSIISNKLYVGWPYCTVREITDHKKTAGYKLNLFLFSCLVSVWIYTLSRLIPIEERFSITNFWYVPTLIIALMHRRVFSSIGVAPISIFGRIKTRKYIIPGYDKIYIPPLLSLLTCSVVYLTASQLTDLYCLAETLAVGSSLYMILSVGPTVREWTYTGQYKAFQPFPRATYFANKHNGSLAN